MKLGALLISALALGACGDDEPLAPTNGDGGDGVASHDFTLRIENVAPWTVLEAGTQATKPDLIDGPAEDGDHAPLLAALQASPPAGVSAVGAFDAPANTAVSSPAMPGQAFELIVHGAPGDALSFATMFGMSNDWFFATRPEGIALFADGVPRTCDVTADVVLYDLGTEVDEELDVGPSTAPQQPAPDTGRLDRIGEVREVTLERYGVPEVLHLRVTLEPR